MAIKFHVMQLLTIKEKYEKSWKYFQDFYISNFNDNLEWDKFILLPFHFQFGVCLLFFNENSTDVDIYSNEEEALFDAINEAFSQYEEYLFLDS